MSPDLEYHEWANERGDFAIETPRVVQLIRHTNCGFAWDATHRMPNPNDERCPECHHEVVDASPPIRGRLMSPETASCDTCRGQGYLPVVGGGSTAAPRCPVCEGTGTLLLHTQEEVDAAWKKAHNDASHHPLHRYLARLLKLAEKRKLSAHFPLGDDAVLVNAVPGLVAEVAQLRVLCAEAAGVFGLTEQEARETVIDGFQDVSWLEQRFVPLWRNLAALVPKEISDRSRQ